MKLAFFISSMTLGGAQRVAATLLNEWARRGIQIDLYTFDKKAESFFSLHESIRVIALDLFSASASKWESISNCIRRSSRIRQVLKESRPDLVVSFMSNMNYLVTAAATGLDLPVVVSERTDPVASGEGIQGTMLRWIFYPNASRVIVQNQRIHEYMPPVVRARSCVISNPVIVPASEKNGSSGALRVLGLGRLSEEKGYDLLMRAFAGVNCSNALLRIVGDGPERARLEALRSELGFGTRVELPGATSTPSEELLSASVFVLSSRFEGSPNALLEAMACGVACVSFDCRTGPRELIRHGENGLLVPPGDVEGLTRAIQQVVDDASLRELLGRNARKSVMKYSLPNVLKQWDRVFEECGCVVDR